MSRFVHSRMLLVPLMVLITPWVGNFSRAVSDSDEVYDEAADSHEEYDKASDYEDDWLTTDGISKTFERQSMVEGGLQSLDITQTAEALQLRWDAIVQGVFNDIQGQKCMDLCVICWPTQEFSISGDLNLTTVSIARAKSALDLLKMPLKLPIGTVTRGLVGWPVSTMNSALTGLAAGIVAGQVAGIATGVRVRAVGDNISHAFKVGTVIGGYSGVATGILVFTGLELRMIKNAMLKGIGLTGKLTKCGRVGFEKFKSGTASESQPFKSKRFDPNFGLKKLRKWNDQIASPVKPGDADVTEQTLSPVQLGDVDATQHCERVREHNFDIRHATQCVKHSQICGGPGFVFPASSPEVCRQLSDMDYFRKEAVKLGKDSLAVFLALLHARKME